ncbi:class II poly(R)-hydroxyalkanoic acid synthase [Pseudomonas capeferrum]|uniref:class II poly(R)-hydroxyalkanoic acid synthase n=1 Tax=Pseudomonas capeferrum TaxID=1495066 RepID=UPI0015E3D059|nr:class II poly(R)-hydroxyalkanoic acid synthase [Pseudomonas capeferrum]MBA1204853.1 class II poly(R)-hydroxyalkanoic acid synthase [Pseudomonas capeferrum]
MKERSAGGTTDVPAITMNVQNAMTGLRGRDLISTLRHVGAHSLRNPVHTARHMLALGSQLSRVMLGDTLHQPNPRDKRFSDPTWEQNPLYRRGLQGYLAWQKQTRLWIEESSLAPDDRARAQFLFSLINDALAPSNSLLNPLAVKELFNTGGQSLVKGLRHLLDDLRHNQGLPRQVDPEAFQVGGNLAVTPGAVVFRNELLELIQYKPMSEKQYARPLLVIPPQINKFYVFDLGPTNSFVQYMLKNGLQVFMVSWRNPEARHRDWGLSNYVQALEEALNACRSITGSRDPNLMGACAGGLTMAALQGHLQARQRLKRVRSATYLVSLLDCEFDSPASLFADEETIEAAKRRSYQRGVLDGGEVSRIFAWMRPNDLIWNYWINNYLLGKTPPAFDILYWNADNTRLPAAFHGELLDFFKLNPLVHPNRLEVCGTPIDLRQVDLDSFTVAGSNDHITPWDAVYRSTMLLGGERRFVLANSGHIQSIINPPGNPKSYYLDSTALASDPRAWLHDATRYEGSWWPAWLGWIGERSGAFKAPRKELGNASYPPLDAAPGTYVLAR